MTNEQATEIHDILGNAGNQVNIALAEFTLEKNGKKDVVKLKDAAVVLTCAAAAMQKLAQAVTKLAAAK